ISFTGLIWLLDGAGSGRGAFLDGWCFGFGFFMAGLYWLANPLLIDGWSFAWAVPFAVAGLPALLALFTGGAVWLTWLTGWRASGRGHGGAVHCNPRRRRGSPVGCRAGRRRGRAAPAGAGQYSPASEVSAGAARGDPQDLSRALQAALRAAGHPCDLAGDRPS